MTFLVFALDFPAMEEKREAVRPRHRAYLAAFGPRLLASGAIMDRDGATIIGGASLIDVADYQSAETFERNDPYALAGIRKTVELLPWRLRWWMGAFDANGFFRTDS